MIFAPSLSSISHSRTTLFQSSSASTHERQTHIHPCPPPKGPRAQPKQHSQQANKVHPSLHSPHSTTCASILPHPPPNRSDTGTVDLATLPPQQLLQVKKQLDTELEHLNNSFGQLRGAQAKFAECARCIETGVAVRDEGAPLLVPLTASLYVPGTLATRDTVLVDVGTGFFVEKDATKFYEAKTKELGTNLKDLEGILQQKSSNLRVVEEGKSQSEVCRIKCSGLTFLTTVLRQKMSAQSQQATQPT
ncbi:hypothetical protein MRB53_037184 [Persea americana]|nr:hypothetical protein MRB53_037184 [Persea americana]